MKHARGSVSIEAAVSLPVFLMAVLAVAALMQYPLANRRVGAAMSDVARMLSAGGYMASLSGLQTLQKDIGRVAKNGMNPGGAKLNEVMAILESLSNTAEGKEEETGSETNGNGENDGDDMEMSGMLKTFLQAGTTITSEGGEMAQNAVDGIFDDFVLDLVSKRLTEASNNRIRGEDPWKRLCIRNGKAGVDFSNSRYYDENGLVELVAVYEVKPVTLLGLAPAVKCCTRVRVVGWGVGEGSSTLSPDGSGEAEADEEKSNESIWNTGSGSAAVWRRGAVIEKKELEKLKKEYAGTGSLFFAASGMQSGYDAASSGLGLEQAAVFQIVSMNPFLSSYAGKPEAIRALLRECAGNMPKKGEMMDCGQSPLPLLVSTREIILVIPENTSPDVANTLEAMRRELAGEHAELHIVRGYGDFVPMAEIERKQDLETDGAAEEILPE